MGMWTTAWLAYGATVQTDRDGEDFDTVLKQHDGVSHLSAGGFDNDRLYFVTYAEDADLGTPATLPADALDPAQCPHWDAQICLAAEACGVELDGEPGWLLIADVS